MWEVQCYIGDLFRVRYWMKSSAYQTLITPLETYSQFNVVFQILL